MERSKEPHLEIVTRQTPGGGLEVFELPLGGYLILHETDVKRTMPMQLVKCTMKSIHLRCGCSNPKCTLVLRLQVERSGAHPPQFRADHK